MDYFHEAFKGLKRLCPGSEETTRKIFELYLDKNKHLKILDVGCGKGESAFLFSQFSEKFDIYAIDIHKPYVDFVNKKANRLGLEDRIHAMVMDMSKISLNKFDVIWAEGSIYILGFEKGLNNWKKHLKKGGLLICSELSFLKSPSKESYSYWKANYSDVDCVENNITKIGNAGFKFLGKYVCPKNDWLKNYYFPLERNIDKLKEKYSENEEAEKVVKYLQEEIDVYRRNLDDYSYVFYIMKNI